MKRFANILLTVLFFSTSLQAQEISGTWHGAVNTRRQEVINVFHIKDSVNILSATLDVPTQFAMNIPVSKITFERDTLHIEISKLNATYNGALNGDSIKGTFSQNGLSFPLILYRGKLFKRPQKPKPPFPYKSEDVTFMNKKDSIQLSGTLTLPKKGDDFAAVVLIWGSGPSDRDETILKHKPFWVIADYLTRKGIAVLRFDKRGIGKSGGDYQTATTLDFASDIKAAVKYLETLKNIDHKKIGLIGHSEGGIIAPIVAADNKNIDFIVLLAGSGFKGSKLMLMQESALQKAKGISPISIEESRKFHKKLFTLVMNNESSDSLNKIIFNLIEKSLPAILPKLQKKRLAFRGVLQLETPWMIEFLELNPQDYLKKVHCPVLALDGSKDLQVPPKRNIAAIKKALTEGGNTNVTTKIFPDLNHLFQKAKTGLPSEYGTIEMTFSPKALKYMGDWILKQVK